MIKPLQNISSNAVTVFNFVSNMNFTIPSVRAITLAEIGPVAAIFPSAIDVTALIVEHITEGGTDANALWDRAAAAREPPATARPCRVSRFANMVLAVINRVEKVP